MPLAVERAASIPSSFDPESLSCRIAGEVKNFKPEDYLAPRELKRVGRAVPLAIAATKEALGVARVCLHETSLEEKRSWGVVLGSGGGTPDLSKSNTVSTSGINCVK